MPLLGRIACVWAAQWRCESSISTRRDFLLVALWLRPFRLHQISHWRPGVGGQELRYANAHLWPRIVSSGGGKACLV
ncbi:hypothetical protein BJX68DRAFT_232469 [Aspergillus pseudodeflectus]|uniref:Secreted protein n=1 Tax=Aspergillus pseudodeflectus TaxID=176178 RepID=A0ABR4KR31_9EURO